MDWLQLFLKLILGLAFFLFGMNVMSANLEKMAGGKLETMLKKMTANPLVSMLLGAAITIAVQSSSATTVMLVGLVNSGIMKVSQTLYVIFGANIGTTLTAWILSLSSISSDNIVIMMMKPENFSPILAIVGVAMIMMGKTDKKKSIGTILVGFAVLMYGMEFMSDAVSPLADLPEFQQWMVKFDNPLLGVMVGLVFTAVIQSSAAAVGVLQALSMTGTISYNMAIPIVMGVNIGTCATALISCVGANANAKKVATIHLSIKVIGTVITLSVYCAVRALFTLSFTNLTIDPFGIALVHTIFNITITLLLLPATKLLEKLADWVVREKPGAEEEALVRLDDRLLRSPSVAINECENYTVHMCALAHQTLLLAVELIARYDAKLAEKIIKNEDKLDRYEDSLGTYLVKISSQGVSESDSQRVSKMLHTIGNFERLGDHAINLVKTATEMHNKGVGFSDAAVHELDVLTEALLTILELTDDAYSRNSVTMAARVEPLEQVIDHLTKEIKNRHVNRLQKGECTIEMGVILSDMLTDYERISDHCSNIAVAIIELGEGSFDTHQYLNDVKYNNEAFDVSYEQYAARFAI